MSERRFVRVPLSLAAFGLALLVLGLVVDPARAWFAYLVAWIFGTTLAVGALILTMVGQAAKAGWMVVLRRPMEAVAGALPLFALLFVPLVFGLDRVYPWAGHTADAALAHALGHKRLWLSRPFFVARTAVYFAVFCGVGRLLRSWSRENDERPSAALVRRMRRLGGGGLPLVGLTLTWASFDWSMSLQPEWWSTMFGFIFFAGAFVGAIALACVWMSGSPAFTPDHAQALGRLLFAMIVFWAYVSYGQLVIYWMGDIPDEVSYFVRRTQGSWAAVTYGIVFGHFVVPFFALLNRRLKRRPQVLAFAGGWILVMHWLDVYWQVLPVHDAAGVRFHWLDVGALLFVGGAASAWVARAYAGAPRLPSNVPELDEGLSYEAAV
jgi:hypothetical protein